MTLKEKLRAERGKKGVSQTKVANDLGLTQPTIAKYENGILTPLADTIVALADYYGVTTDYLLRD